MDYVLLFLVVGMVLFGLLMVYSASYIFAHERTGDGFAFIKKQLIFAIVGGLAALGAYRLDYRLWTKLAYPILGLATLCLGLVLVPGLGVVAGGARRWIDLGFFHFQPGEVAKFAIILFAAHQLGRKKDRLNRLVPGLISPVLLTIPAFALLLTQPDFGSVLITGAIVLGLMYVAGVPTRFLAPAVVIQVAIGGYLVFGAAYRRARLETFLDPWSDPEGKGFQILQSLVGLHNGKLWGVGLGNGKEKLFFLPEAHNDFIFSVIGEELGFIGLAAVVSAFIVLLLRGLRISWSRHAEGDFFGSYLAAGISLALGFQAFVNMAVVLGLVPTKGLTLPFISYGGSSLIVDLIAMGVLLSISRGPKSESVEGVIPKKAALP